MKRMLLCIGLLGMFIGINCLADTVVQTNNEAVYSNTESAGNANLDQQTVKGYKISSEKTTSYTQKTIAKDDNSTVKDNSQNSKDVLSNSDSDISNQRSDDAFVLSLLEVVGVVILYVFILYYILLILFLALFYVNFKAIPAEHCKMSPGKVWLSLIPFFGIVWNFFIVSRLSRSYMSYFDSVGVKDVGECGRLVGIFYCISSILGLVFFPAGELFGIISLVLVICYLVIVFKLRRRVLVLKKDTISNPGLTD